MTETMTKKIEMRPILTLFETGLKGLADNVQNNIYIHIYEGQTCGLTSYMKASYEIEGQELFGREEGAEVRQSS